MVMTIEHDEENSCLDPYDTMSNEMEDAPIMDSDPEDSKKKEFIIKFGMPVHEFVQKHYGTGTETLTKMRKPNNIIDREIKEYEKEKGIEKRIQDRVQGILDANSEIIEQMDIPKNLEDRYRWHGFVADFENSCLNRIRKEIEHAARYDYPVMLLGDTGTGKEVVAKAIHEAWVDNKRGEGNMTPINLGLLDPNRAESDLFGHIKGAFSGAIKNRPGLLKSSIGSTIFLDEFGAAAPQVQAGLLRFIETKEIRPTGSDEYEKIKVRVIAATNALDSVPIGEIDKLRIDILARFRKRIQLPKISEHPEDIPVLAVFLANKMRIDYGFKSKLNKTQIEQLLYKLITDPNSFVYNIRSLEGYIQDMLEQNDDISGISRESIMEAIKFNKTKIDLAAHLGISRPTLDKYLELFSIPFPPR